MSGLEIKGAFVFKSSRRPNNCKTGHLHRWYEDNSSEWYKDGKCTCEASKTTTFFCIVNYASFWRPCRHRLSRLFKCYYVRGKSGKDRQFYFPASSLARNADSCNVSYTGVNKWGGLRTEAQFQGGQRTYSFQWLRLCGEKERVNLGKPIFIPNVARRALFAINFTYPTLLNWVWLYLARPTGLLQNKDIFFLRSTASLTH